MRINNDSRGNSKKRNRDLDIPDGLYVELEEKPRTGRNYEEETRLGIYVI